MNQTLWYKDAVFYQIYPRAFYDSNGDGHGDLRGLAQKLDYLRDLGIDCLWLMPIYPSPLKDDGYDIADFYGVHSDYGTLDDFKVLLEAAHTRGIRLIADLVLNHTSDQHPWFQAARADRNSPYREYYVWSDTDQKYSDARIIFIDTERSNWTWDPVAGQYYWHRFYASQPDLNYDSPAVRAEMLNVMKFWLDLGIDGFRADAVPYLVERDGTTCENLPETHAYLKELRRLIEENYPGRILLCEANQWPRDVRVYFGDDDEFHMAFHFPLMPRVFMALRRGNAEPIRWVLEETPTIPANSQWGTFLRNHDELTLEMVSEGERQWMWNEYAPDPRMRLNLGIRRRLAPLLDNDRRKIELAHSLLFTLPGSPIIYYGDEIGMGENIWLPDRNGVRTPMQWDNTPNAGFSSAEKLYSPVIDISPSKPAQVNVLRQCADFNSLWNTIRKMIAVRKQYRSFGRGDFEWLDLQNKHVASFKRTIDNETILAIHNLSDDTQTIALKESKDGSFRDILGDQRFELKNGRATIELTPFQYLWLSQIFPAT